MFTFIKLTKTFPLKPEQILKFIILEALLNCFYMDWKKLLNDGRLRSSNRGKDDRNEYESDFGRIIFSPATRRMHDKTQVFPLTADDNIHSRLTHSMEVMSVGYTLAVKVCESEVFKKKFAKNTYELFRQIPMIIKNVCLIHDIGNPPFGHFGETIIQHYFKTFFASSIVKANKEEFSEEDLKSGKICLTLSDHEKKDFIDYDGNAQGLRVLTKLQILNDIFGLNLTFATLSAYIKYPNYEKIDKSIIEKNKHGVFASEKQYFFEIFRQCDLIKNDDTFLRNPLCYLMEAADSICYLTMDIEDGYNKKLIDIDDLYAVLKEIPSIKNKIEEIYKDEKKYYKNDITKMVNFRIHIISVLVDLAASNFEKNIELIESGSYNKELIFDDPTNQLAKKLKGVCEEKIFVSRDINYLEMTGHSVMKGILDYYLMLIFHPVKKYRNKVSSLISKSILNAAYEENHLQGEKAIIDNLPDYYKLRIVVDFISGMTDQFALDHYQKLSGQKIN